MMIRSLDIPKETRREWFNLLKFDITDAVLARRDWFGDYCRGYRNYRAIPPGPKNVPWPNCSNLIPPLTTMITEQTIRRIVMYYVQNRPEYVGLKSNSSASESLGRADKVQEMLRHQGDNEFDYWHFVDGFAREFVTGGTSFGWLNWLYCEELVADTLIVGRDRIRARKNRGQPGIPEYMQVGEPQRKTSNISELFKELLGSQGMKVRSYKKLNQSTKDIWYYHVEFKDERGRAKTAYVTVDRAEDLGDQVEVVGQIPRLVKNQPMARNLTADRVIVPPGEWGIQDAPFVGIKEYVPWNLVQYWQKKRYWRLDNEEMGVLEDMFRDDKGYGVMDKGGGDYSSFEDEPDARQEQDMYVGVDSEKFRRRLIPVIHVMRKWPIVMRDKSQMPEAFMTILPRHGMIARTQFASVEGVPTMRNLVSHHFIKARHEFYGISLPRLLESYQEEMTAVVNMQIDSYNLTTTPTIFLDHTATLSRDNMGYAPGSTIKVNRPNENVMIPSFPHRGPEFEAQIARLNAYGQDLGQQGSEAVGRDFGSKNRTARGAQMLMGEKNFNIEYSAEAIAGEICRFWRIIYNLDVKNLPRNYEFAAFGTNEIIKFKDRSEIRGDYEFQFQVGAAILNNEMKRLRAAEFTQMAAPVAAASPEQITKPLWELYIDLGKAYGFKNPEKYFPQPVGPRGLSLSPEDEHWIFTKGHPVSVHPMDNDQFHLEAHQMFAMSPEFGLMPRDMIGAFQQHMMLHLQRVQAGQKAGNIGATGQNLGGKDQMQGNPAMNSSPGQPPTSFNEGPPGPETTAPMKVIPGGASV